MWWHGLISIVTWLFILINLQLQVMNLALSDTYYATLAVKRADTEYAHKLFRRATRLRRWAWPWTRILPQGDRLYP